jgi:hypothetical protein
MTTRTAEKPGRLLSSGAVQIIFATDQFDQSRVRGDSGPIYDVRWSRLAGWDCTCAAYGECTHRKAVAQVTMRPVTRATQDPEPEPRFHLERSVDRGQAPESQDRAGREDRHGGSARSGDWTPRPGALDQSDEREG